MGKLIYSMNVSLDGYIETPDRSLDWTVVDDELHSWFNDLVREMDVFLYGRRMYEVMSAYWPTAESDPGATDVTRDFARIWNARPKVVFSSTLKVVQWKSRLAAGDPAEELARIRAEFDGDIGVGGAHAGLRLHPSRPRRRVPAPRPPCDPRSRHALLPAARDPRQAEADRDAHLCVRRDLARLHARLTSPDPRQEHHFVRSTAKRGEGPRCTRSPKATTCVR